MIEFKPWGKTPRLFRDMVVTEKIDGTNSAVIIEEHPFGTHVDGAPEGAIAVVCLPDDEAEDGLPQFEYLIGAQSRNRLITPGKMTDNYGFAGWVERNRVELVRHLGPGHHFGEWWGQGIARKYGMTEKRFSLFNTFRYADIAERSNGLLHVVPVLHEGPLATSTVHSIIANLNINGSVAAPDFMKPEGVCVFHSASSQVFKVLCENDDIPKGLVA